MKNEFDFLGRAAILLLLAPLHKMDEKRSLFQYLINILSNLLA